MNEAGKMRIKDRKVPPWWRLPHEDLGMPTPAVYLPQRSLPPDTRGMWGFEPIVTRAADKPIPYARRGELTLVADICSPDGMDILIAPASAFAQGVEHVAVDRPQVLAVGRLSSRTRLIGWRPPMPPEVCWL
jgi:hypothetical protein